MAKKQSIEELLGDGSKKKASRGLYNRFIDKVKTFAHDVYDVKIPLSLATFTVTTDRILTYLLINGGLGYEANQAAAASQHALGLDGGLITTWFIGLAAAGVFGAAFERIANVPRNYLVKAALYGAAATEGVVSLNNYLVMTQPQNNPFAQIQTGTFLDLVFSAPFISTGVATAYHYLKSKKSEKTSCSNSLSKASSDKRPTRNYKESYQA